MEQDQRMEIAGAGIPFQNFQEWEVQDPVRVQEELGGQGHYAVPDENDVRPQRKNHRQQPTFRLALVAGDMYGPAEAVDLIPLLQKAANGNKGKLMPGTYELRLEMKPVQKDAQAIHTILTFKIL